MKKEEIVKVLLEHKYLSCEEETKIKDSYAKVGEKQKCLMLVVFVSVPIEIVKDGQSVQDTATQIKFECSNLIEGNRFFASTSYGFYVEGIDNFTIKDLKEIEIKMVSSAKILLPSS